MSAKLIQVIEAVIARGEGTPDNPHRMVTQYFRTDGWLLAEVDPTAHLNAAMRAIRSLDVCVSCGGPVPCPTDHRSEEGP